LDLAPIHSVRVFVKEENSKKKSSKQKEGVPKRDVVRGLNISEREAARCLKYLSESQYLEVIKTKGRVFFFSEEKYDGTFEGRFYGKAILDAMKRRFQEVINFVKGRPKVITEDLQKDYEKVISTADSDRPNIEAYNKVVQFAFWSNGNIKPVKLSFRSNAYRYA
jgi:hypothetical protein